MPHGKQTLKQLMKQNAGVSNIEITKDKEHMEMEYARHFLRALKLLEEAQRGNEDPDTLINGLLQAATEFYDADSHILSKRIGRQALA